MTSKIPKEVTKHFLYKKLKDRIFDNNTDIVFFEDMLKVKNIIRYKTDIENLQRIIKSLEKQKQYMSKLLDRLPKL